MRMVQAIHLRRIEQAARMVVEDASAESMALLAAEIEDYDDAMKRVANGQVSGKMARQFMAAQPAA